MRMSLIVTVAYGVNLWQCGIGISGNLRYPSSLTNTFKWCFSQSILVTPSDFTIHFLDIFGSLHGTRLQTLTGYTALWFMIFVTWVFAPLPKHWSSGEFIVSMWLFIPVQQSISMRWRYWCLPRWCYCSWMFVNGCVCDWTTACESLLWIV